MTTANAALMEAAVYPSTSYQDPTPTSSTSFSSNLPVVRGKGNYKIDLNLPTRDDDYRKAWYGHPTLTLGIFVLMESVMDLKSWEIANHQRSPSISSLQDFVLHLM